LGKGLGILGNGQGPTGQGSGMCPFVVGIFFVPVQYLHSCSQGKEKGVGRCTGISVSLVRLTVHGDEDVNFGFLVLDLFFFHRER